MRLRGKPVSNLTPDDLAALEMDEVPESVDLDYKESLALATPSDRREFVRDAVAMANTHGGVLLFGVSERVEDGKKTGVPECIVGLRDLTVDHERLRIEQALRDLADPPLSGCAIHAFEVSAGSLVLVVGVPRSLLGPHAASGIYYRRAGAGNYQVPSGELRRMFMERGTWEDEVRAFRDARIAKARAGTTAPRLDTRGATILHVLPLGRLGNLTDIVQLRDEFKRAYLLKMNLPLSARPNLDGYLLWDESAEDCKQYVQWFRFGGMEFYSSLFHRVRTEPALLDLDGIWLASTVRQHASTAIALMRDHLSIDPPYAVFLSVFDVEDGRLLIDGWGHVLNAAVHRRSRFRDDPLVLPPGLIEDAATDLRSELMPLLDMVWQASGLIECPLRHVDAEKW